jgi:hypothetical protein
VASDVFLFQKQQTFNRSKVVERAVHPSGSGAFGYFECTKDVTALTVSSYLSLTAYELLIELVESQLLVHRWREDPRFFALLNSHTWT